MADEVEKKTSYSTGSQLQAEVEAGQRALARRRVSIQETIDGRPPEARPMQGNTDELTFVTGLAPASVQQQADFQAQQRAVVPPQDVEEMKAAARAEAIAEERARVAAEQQQAAADAETKARAEAAAQEQAAKDAEAAHTAKAKAAAAAKPKAAAPKPAAAKPAEAPAPKPADETDSAVDDILGS